MASNFYYYGLLCKSNQGTVLRMKAIIRILRAPMNVLKAQHIDEEYLGVLLEELQDLVSTTEMSLEFHIADGLVPLLNCLKTFNAGHRAKAANVVATLVWGNAYNQKLVMEAKGFKALFDVFTSDPYVETRTNALGAIFSLIRNNKPAIVSFHCADGYEALKDPLTSQDVCYQRKALDLIYLILQEDPIEHKIMHEVGIPRMMATLGNSEDAKVRESALWGLLKLACLMKDMEDNLHNDNLKDDFNDAVKPLVEERIGHSSSMSDEELKESRTERVLAEKLWRTCFEESSCLWDEGLLPGEDEVLSDLQREPFASPVRRFHIEQVFDSEDSDSPMSDE